MIRIVGGRAVAYQFPRTSASPASYAMTRRSPSMSNYRLVAAKPAELSEETQAVG